jgi:hypothetical protein
LHKLFFSVVATTFFAYAHKDKTFLNERYVGKGKSLRNVFFYFLTKKIWIFQNKAVPLHQEIKTTKIWQRN